MTFKILSLDGGGIRGVLSARILKPIETKIKEKTGQELHEYFDLVAGTSTGSIMAAGIACGKTADELINLYKNEGENIFVKSIRRRRKWRWLSRLTGGYVLYPHEHKEQGLAKVLEKQLQGKTIADISSIHLLIPAYDVLSRNTTWFANDDPKEWYYKNKLPLWQICTASASAPTYFPPYPIPYNSESQEYLPHIDGGVSANNPELVAIAHALSMTTKNNQPTPKIDDIAVLSIGTGRATRPYEYDEIKKWGLLNWVQNITNIFMDPSSENSGYISKRVFSGIKNPNYLRLNFNLNEERSETREPGKLLRPLLRNQNKPEKPYNKYVYIKDNKKEPISEEIDNPEICKDLIRAAECYLEQGKVEYNNQKNITVESAIQQFIDSNGPWLTETEKSEENQKCSQYQ